VNRYRRTAAAGSFRKWDNFCNSYLTHLPKVDGPVLNKPGLTHVVFFHDDWCGIHTSSRNCTSNPEVEFESEPHRS